MKVINISRRPVWVDGIKIMPMETKEIPDEFKNAIKSLPLTPVEYVKIKPKPKESELNKLIALEGVEREIAEMLLDKFGSIENIKKATRDQLMRLPSIGQYRADLILKQLKEEEVGGKTEVKTEKEGEK